MGRTRSFDESTVLDSVRDEFWENGYEGTSTYDLMEVTGLGKGSIYHAYGNERELYLRVFATYCDELVAAARRSLNDEAIGSPGERLESYMMTLAEAFGSESPRRGCFLSRAVADLASTNEDVARIAREAFTQIAGALAETIRAAQAAGEVGTSVDADSLGYMLLSVIRGIDNLAKGSVNSLVLQEVARSAITLLSP